MNQELIINSKEVYSPKEEILKIFRGEDIGYFPRSILVCLPTVEIIKKASIRWKKVFSDG